MGILERKSKEIESEVQKSIKVTAAPMSIGRPEPMNDTSMPSAYTDTPKEKYENAPKAPENPPQDPQTPPLFDPERAKHAFNQLRIRIDTFFSKLFALEKELVENYEQLPKEYNLSEIKLSLNNMLEDYKELRQVYYEGSEGYFNHKIAGLVYSEVTVPIPVNNIRRIVAKIFTVLNGMKAEAQEAFDFLDEYGDTEEKRILKWELAYLANISMQYMKLWATYYNNKQFWYRPPTRTEEKPFGPEETPRVNSPLRMINNIWEEGKEVEIMGRKYVVVDVEDTGFTDPVFTVRDPKGRLYEWVPYRGLKRKKGRL